MGTTCNQIQQVFSATKRCILSTQKNKNLEGSWKMAKANGVKAVRSLVLLLRKTSAATTEPDDDRQMIASHHMCSFTFGFLLHHQVGDALLLANHKSYIA